MRRIVGSRRVPWSEISSLRLRDKGGVRAVLSDGAELPLPSVRVRDLPQLAAASGGRPTQTLETDDAGASFPRDHPRPQHRRSPRALARHRDDATTTSASRSSRSPTPTPSSCPATCTSRTSARSSPTRSREAGRRRRASSTRSPSTTASRWATAGCSTRCPRRELIADAVEYMVNAHCADALVCISNCDKITPGHAASPRMRLNIPTVFVSGGPMEAGKAVVVDGVAHGTDRPDHRDLRVGERRRSTDDGLDDDRALRLPDLRLVLGHVHRQLDELPDRGARPRAARQRLHAGHARGPARRCSSRPARTVVDLAAAVLRDDDASVLPRNDRHPGGVRERDGARRRHGRLDQHGAAPPRRRAGGRGRLRPRRRSTRSPAGCRACPRSRRTRDYHMEDVHRAGGIPAILGELRPRRPARRRDVHTVHSPSLDDVAGRRGTSAAAGAVRDGGRAVPRRAGRGAHHRAVLHGEPLDARWTPTPRAAASATSRTPTPPTAGWPCCAATSPPTARWSRPPGIAEELWHFAGPARVVESPGGGRLGDPRQAGQRRRRGRRPLRGPHAAARACRRCCTPPRSSRARGLGRVCALITDGRFSGGISRPLDRATSRPRPRRAA